MKRILVCLIALGLALSVVGCGGGTTTSDGDGTTTTTVPGTTTTTVAGTTTTTTTGTTTTTYPDVGGLPEYEMAGYVASMGWFSASLDEMIVGFIATDDLAANLKHYVNDWYGPLVPGFYYMFENYQAKMWMSGHALVDSFPEVDDYIAGNREEIHMVMTLTPTSSGTMTIESGSSFGIDTSDPLVVDYVPAKTVSGPIVIVGVMDGQSYSVTTRVDFTSFSAIAPYYPTGTATAEFNFGAGPIIVPAEYDGDVTASVGPFPSTHSYTVNLDTGVVTQQ